MSRSYVIENRPGFRGAFTRVTDETPAEAREREAAWEAHKAAIRRSDELSQQDHRAHLERQAARDEEAWI